MTSNFSFLTTFAQLSARLKNFLRGWLFVLGLKEGLVEWPTVCVKSVVILTFRQGLFGSKELQKRCQHVFPIF